MGSFFSCSVRSGGHRPRAPGSEENGAEGKREERPGEAGREREGNFGGPGEQASPRGANERQAKAGATCVEACEGCGVHARRPREAAHQRPGLNDHGDPCGSPEEPGSALLRCRIAASSSAGRRRRSRQGRHQSRRSKEAPLPGPFDRRVAVRPAQVEEERILGQPPCEGHSEPRGGR